MDKRIFRDISYGMYFVSSIIDDKKVGCVINTLCQITSNDPVISISLNKNNYTNEAVKESKKFAVSIMSINTSKEVIGKFGYQTSREVDKFNDIKYEIVDGIPVVEENICGYLILEVIEMIDCGTHDVFLSRVVDTKKEDSLDAMTYKYYHEKLKGTSPPSAPTYVEVLESANSESAKYRCSLCGYIYDDSKESVKFVDLPDDWKCPLCGASKEMFVKV